MAKKKQPESKQHGTPDVKPPASQPVEPSYLPLSAGWKFTAFLWATSMLFLGLYDVLSQILRALFR